MQKDTFETFDELFEAAILYESIEQPKNESHKKAVNNYYSLIFNEWLQKNRNLEYGNKLQYKKLLTKQNWLAFMDYQKTKTKNHKENLDIETSSWQSEEQIISFDDDKYKLDFQFGFIPQSIWDYYKNRNEFKYISTDTIKHIPVLKVSMEFHEIREKENNEAYKEFMQCFPSYARGFLKGFEFDFTPFINTPETTKEMVLKGININMMKSFPEANYVREDGTILKTYEEKHFYEFGLEVGKNYKAWLMVLQTPEIYKNEFPFTLGQKPQQRIKSDSEILAEKQLNDFDKNVKARNIGIIVAIGAALLVLLLWLIDKCCKN